MNSDPSALGGALDDFSLREASRLYAVELTTLQGLVRRGRIDAFKARGPWGREWRVTRMALEAMGYVPRPGCESAGVTGERVTRLEKELAAARRNAAAERRRAEEADRRLEEALMESGRLRAELAATHGEQKTDAPPAEEMDEFRGAVLRLGSDRLRSDAS